MTRGYHHNWRKTSGVLCDKRIHQNWRKTSGVLCDKRIPSQLDVGGPKTSGVQLEEDVCDKRIPSQLGEDVGDPM